MEILILVLLYYLSQNPDFAESVKPLMSQIKNSQQMLSFLNDLSKFSQTFSTFKNEPCGEQSTAQPPPSGEKPGEKKSPNEKTPQSPTAGIADDFIQNILDSYLKNHVK